MLKPEACLTVINNMKRKTQVFTENPFPVKNLMMFSRNQYDTYTSSKNSDSIIQAKPFF